VAPAHFVNALADERACEMKHPERVVEALFQFIVGQFSVG
jgi:hypothetical protein